MQVSKKKVLILLTNGFPYGNSEPYLMEEYPYLNEKFDSVIIISTAKILNQTSSLKDHYNFHINANYFQPQEIIKALMKLAVLKELTIQFFKGKLSFYKIKLILSYFIRATRLKEKIIDLITTKKLEKHNLIIYSYWCDEKAIAACLIKNEIAHCRAVSRAHGWDLYIERSPENYLPLRRWIVENLNKIYCISYNGQKYLTDNHKKFADNILLSRLGSVPISNIPVVETMQVKVYYILSIAYIVPLKRIDKIIKALEYIHHIEIHWVHIGGGIQADEIQNLAKNRLQNKMNIEYDFKGNLNHDEIIEYLSQQHFDIFINVSETEGLPVSIMEAMSAGIPVIATDVGGTSEIVNDQNGYLIAKETPDDEIAKILEQHFALDPPSVQQKRENALNTFNSGFNSKINYAKFANELISVCP